MICIGDKVARIVTHYYASVPIFIIEGNAKFKLEASENLEYFFVVPNPSSWFSQIQLMDPRLKAPDTVPFSRILSSTCSYTFNLQMREDNTHRRLSRC